MTERRRPRVHQATVRRTEWLTPHMIRVVLGGEDFAGSTPALHRPLRETAVPHARASSTRSRSTWAWSARPSRRALAATRTYTVRSWDEDSKELTIDFVYHGDEGVAGPWAAAAQPATCCVQGPGGAYVPGRAADWHLLVGDESALPAIAASLERLPAGAPARVFIEVAGPDEEQKLSISDGVELVWVHRGHRPVGEALVDAVSAVEFLPGRVQAFVHGEAHFVKRAAPPAAGGARRDRDQLSISGYWRRGNDEDGWQTSKREWNERVELDELAPWLRFPELRYRAM